MWSYKIDDVNIVNGVLQVRVEFSDDDGIFNTFTENIETKNVLEENWTDSYCKRRVKELDSLAAYATRISNQSVLVFKDVPTPLKPKSDPVEIPMVMK